MNTRGNYMSTTEMNEFLKDFCNKDFDTQVADLKAIASKQGKSPLICMAESGEHIRDLLIRWRLEEVEELRQITFQQ